MGYWVGNMRFAVQGLGVYGVADKIMKPRNREEGRSKSQSPLGDSGRSCWLSITRYAVSVQAIEADKCTLFTLIELQEGCREDLRRTRITPLRDSAISSQMSLSRCTSTLLELGLTGSASLEGRIPRGSYTDALDHPELGHAGPSSGYVPSIPAELMIVDSPTCISPASSGRTERNIRCLSVHHGKNLARRTLGIMSLLYRSRTTRFS
jgi:hypothetical protein